ncbi:hypothetical protein TNCV_1844531 [Trichonephila clavipes]|nr:hypothetical protein TNCV_1844531 [Trichonephila clavipes]
MSPNRPFRMPCLWAQRRPDPRLPRNLPEGGRSGIRLEKSPKNGAEQYERLRIRRDHPPNLSISVSGGKEN